MAPEKTQTKPPLTFRGIIAAAPTKTLLAAGFLGLMWGPILATVMNAVDQVHEDQVEQAEADRLDPLPVKRRDPLRSRATAQAPAVTATDVVSTASSIKADDAALDRLQGLTRYHGLSNVAQDPPTAR